MKKSKIIRTVATVFALIFAFGIAVFPQDAYAKKYRQPKVSTIVGTYYDNDGNEWDIEKTRSSKKINVWLPTFRSAVEYTFSNKSGKFKCDDWTLKFNVSGKKVKATAVLDGRTIKLKKQ